ncbi:hypothetical protein QBC34DRAFT_496775 [Podospora aff. communis PSN243]|uniref:Chitin-binding type-3 domain-containing protein n=1 Tax=Podospora aff. communis PSN243 TaxID=3040156 RepID=A0AAV9GDD2_9PEZI|nr:hypothetical protein QBC34DRAFT_496775 [Podospora aff. communis PSN243]
MLIHHILNLLFFLVTAWPGAIPSCTPLDTAAPAWDPNRNYAVSTLVRYEGRFYVCLQAHHSSALWAPPAVPALWETPTPCGVTEWQTQTHYAIGSQVTYAAKVYECIQAHTAYDSWFPPDTPALWRYVKDAGPGPNPTSECIVEQHGVYTQSFVETTEKTPSGKEVKGTILWAVPRPRPGDQDTWKTLKEFTSTSVYVGKDELFSVKSVRNLADTVSGQVDGRTFKAASATEAFVYDDGLGPPKLVPKEPNLQPVLDKLQAALLRKIGECRLPKTPILVTNTTCTSSTYLVKSQPLAGRNRDAVGRYKPPVGNWNRHMHRQQPLDRTQNPGHQCEWEVSTFNCESCKAGCYGMTVLEEVPCLVVCYATLFFACGACHEWVHVDPTDCLSDCRHITCCPTHCGPRTLPDLRPSCCEGDNSCLSNDRGTGCDKGLEPCEGVACCNPDTQQCVHGGPQKGYCCPKEAFLDGVCCEDDDDKSFGFCCPRDKLCGDDCCWWDKIRKPDIFMPATECKTDGNGNKRCCLPGEELSKGYCCPVGSAYTDGVCCHDGEKNCGDNDIL